MRPHPHRGDERIDEDAAGAQIAEESDCGGAARGEMGGGSTRMLQEVGGAERGEQAEGAARRVRRGRRRPLRRVGRSE